jgi:hypothetical protein
MSEIEPAILPRDYGYDDVATARELRYVGHFNETKLGKAFENCKNLQLKVEYCV